MIDAHKDFIAALNTILPTHYEMTLHSGLDTPCISYMGISNAVNVNGDTLGYSNIAFQVKVWANNISLIVHYAQEIDKVLRPLGWKRTNYNELYDINSNMIQGVMNYEAIGLEQYI